MKGKSGGTVKSDLSIHASRNSKEASTKIQQIFNKDSANIQQIFNKYSFLKRKSGGTVKSNLSIHASTNSKEVLRSFQTNP